jgi:hypothetical protein
MRLKFYQSDLSRKSFFLRKSQVKSPKSQVMTLTFSKRLFENTFRRFLQVPNGYLIIT